MTNAKFMTEDYERIIANTMEAEDDDESCIIILWNSETNRYHKE